MIRNSERFKNVKAVLFDVDGTLLNVKEGYCRGINDALSFYGFRKIDEDKIWKLRRNGINAFQILEKTVGKEKKLLPLVEEMRRRSRETIEYRNLDRPFKNVKTTLLKLRKMRKKIFITSLRKSKRFLINQLDDLGLYKFVDDVFVINENPAGKNHDFMKTTLIEKLIRKHKFAPSECAIVGDTVADIRGGKQTGVKTVAIPTGLAGRKLLANEKPDRIINDISDVVKILE